jgi:hypothetical protein
MSQSLPSLSSVSTRLRNRVPSHLPLSVKVRNLSDEKWLENLEVEVRNLSNKPIYFLEFFLEMPEIRDENGVEFVFPLVYGRNQLVSYLAPLEPTDVPISPGETYIYKVDPGQIKGWGKYKAAKGKPEPRRVDLTFVQLSFGDGTGFEMTNGTPINTRKSSKNAVPKTMPTTLSELFPALNCMGRQSQVSPTSESRLM